MRITLGALCALLVATVSCGGGGTNADTTEIPSTDPNNTGDTLSNTDNAAGDQDILAPAERTEDMIAADVLIALESNDVDLAAAYLPTIQNIEDGCPELFANPDARAELERDMTGMGTEMAESFGDCRALIDFTNAEVSHPEWEHKGDVPDCSRITRMSRGRIEVTSRAGFVELNLQVVTLHDGSMFLGDSPRCWEDE